MNVDNKRLLQNTLLCQTTHAKTFQLAFNKVRNKLLEFIFFLKLTCYHNFYLIQFFNVFFFSNITNELNFNINKLKKIDFLRRLKKKEVPDLILSSVKCRFFTYISTKISYKNILS